MNVKLRFFCVNLTQSFESLMDNLGDLFKGFTAKNVMSRTFLLVAMTEDTFGASHEGCP